MTRRLSSADVERIEALLVQGELPQREIARRLGFSRGTVNAIASARINSDERRQVEAQRRAGIVDREPDDAYQPPQSELDGWYERQRREREAESEQNAAAYERRQQTPCDLCGGLHDPLEECSSDD